MISESKWSGKLRGEGDESLAFLCQHTISEAHLSGEDAIVHTFSSVCYCTFCKFLAPVKHSGPALFDSKVSDQSLIETWTFSASQQALNYPSGSCHLKKPDEDRQRISPSAAEVAGLFGSFASFFTSCADCSGCFAGGAAGLAADSTGALAIAFAAAGGRPELRIAAFKVFMYSSCSC